MHQYASMFYFFIVLNGIKNIFDAKALYDKGKSDKNIAVDISVDKQKSDGVDGGNGKDDI